MSQKQIKKALSILSSKLGMELEFNKDYYWDYDDYFVFGYNSKSYLSGGNLGHALTANFPILLSKKANEEDIYQLEKDGLKELKNKPIQELIDNNWIVKIDFKLL